MNFKFPWETDALPAPVEPVPLPAPVDDVRETVRLMQKDLQFMTLHTAVLVHSNRPELQMLVNVPRGQIIPRGVCKFADGSTTEFQDIGMPQPNAPLMNVDELMARTWDVAHSLGLVLS